MRKIIFLLVLTVASHIGFAQFTTVQFAPATYTADDAVTFSIDLTGTSLAGEPEVYIWIFANDGAGGAFPNKDGFTNTAWGNSPANAKFTNLGGNKWSFSFTGTNMFAPLAPGQLKYFQFLVKTKTGSKQTSNSPQYPFAPVVYVPTVYRLFPGRMDQNDAISIYFYQNLATSLTETRMTPVSATVKLYNSANVQVGANIVLPLKNLGQKLFAAKAFIPSTAVTIPAGTILSSFTYVINGTSFDTNGATINVAGSVNTRSFDVLK